MPGSGAHANPSANPTGLIIAAPASGNGKTTVTLGLLRALHRRGVDVAPAKVGPDYIDPTFHEAAARRPSATLDCWAMAPARIAAQADRSADLTICEGVMGLFDGATDGSGSTADLAALTGWPVLLVVDATAQAGSAAAVVHGFTTWRDDVSVAGVIFNRVGSPGHAEMLCEATAATGVAVLGCLPRNPALTLPDRHLGLVQAEEIAELETKLDAMADWVDAALDLEVLTSLASASHLTGSASIEPPVPPLGQHVAIARDEAFRFAYAHVLDGWRSAGAALSFFSPLADEPPMPDADAVYLPGGYPELHAGRLAAASDFLAGLRAAAARGAAIYGECGGYMVLGAALADADAGSHAMAGLLPLETSFADRKLHLGYRRAMLTADGPLGAAGDCFTGHEFHYASIVREGGAERLFDVSDARGERGATVGLRQGAVFGSFVHLIDRN